MARATRSNKRKAGVVAVDFTGVESSGKVEEGRQLVKVDGVPEVKTSDNSGTDYINWKLKATGGVIYHTTSLQPQALWNLRNTLEALGQEVPEGPLDLDLSELDGLEMGVEVEHETYQGKKRPRIIDVFPAEEVDGEEEEEEEAPKKGGKPAAKGGKAKQEEEEESELPTYAEVQEEDDKDALLELAEEHEVKLTVKQKKSVQAIRDAICAALELEAEEEEEEGDEPTYESVQEMDKDELLALAEENDIKVPVKTKRNLDALRELICTELELEEEEEEEAPKTTRRKSGSKTIEKGSKVTFTDDGEEIEGKVKSVNAKEKFAVVDVDGEEWEVELDDLKLA